MEIEDIGATIFCFCVAAILGGIAFFLFVYPAHSVQSDGPVIWIIGIIFFVFWGFLCSGIFAENEENDKK